MNKKNANSSLYFLVGILLLFSGMMGQNTTFYVLAFVFIKLPMIPPVASALQICLSVK